METLLETLGIDHDAFHICEFMPDAIAIVGEGGIIRQVNSATEAMFQYGRAELIGAPVELLVPDRLKALHADHRAIFSGRPEARPMGGRSSLLGRRKDGTEFPVEISLSPMPQAGRSLVLTVIRDVAVRRQTEEALRESEQRYRSLVELSPETIFVHSGGTILYANPAAVRAFGAASADDVVGRSYLEYLQPEDRDRIRRRVERFEREGKKSDFYEERFTTPGGEPMHAELIVSAVNFKGVPARQIVVRDVTERKKAEAALRESEESYRSLVELSPEATIVHTEGRIQYANEAAARLMGAEKPSDLVGQCIQDFIPEEYKEEMRRRKERVLEAKGEVESLQISTCWRDGRPLFIDAVSAPITRRGTRVIQTILRNVTAQKLAEAELRNSREQLRNLSKHLQAAREEERTSVAREIHDELGQDMTALKLDLAWLEESLLESGEVEAKEAHLAKVRSMESLVDAMIHTVRKIMTQLRPVLLDSLGLTPAMEWQAEEFEGRTGIVCRFRSGPPDVELDRDRSTALFRIFQETLTNITRHAGASEVSVTLTRQNRGVELVVRDNGCGIAPKDLAKEHSFGLIGMRERALMFGGDVQIAGSEGGGTTVTVRMPL